MDNRPDVRIAILNYNGAEIMRKCLPSVMAAAKLYGENARITVIDNNSTDESIRLLREEFPGVTVYRSPENKFLLSYNEYLRTITEEIAVILNNDIKVAPDFIKPLIGYFQRPDTFFVSPRIMSFDGSRYIEGNNRIAFKMSFICGGPKPGGIKNSAYSAYTGNGAFRVKAFLDMGGFDGIFFPGYSEDVDLCYRAWKKGYRGYYEPSSEVFHMESVTFKKYFSADEKLKVSYRNSFIFGWKNFSGLFLALNLVMLPATLVVFVLTGRFRHLKGFFSAFVMAGRIKRLKERPKMSDWAIRRMISAWKPDRVKQGNI
jgi:GT2 family glycosyltransferase